MQFLNWVLVRTIGKIAWEIHRDLREEPGRSKFGERRSSEECDVRVHLTKLPCSRGTDFCSREVTCNSRRTSAQAWQLANLTIGGAKFSRAPAASLGSDF